MQGLRTVFQDLLHAVPPPDPAPLAAAAYGTVSLTEAASLLASLDVLAGTPNASREPLTMEQYGQGYAQQSGFACVRSCRQHC